MSAQTEAQLLLATRVLEAAGSAAEAASDAVDQHERQIADKAEELARLEDHLKRHRVSIALGEPWAEAVPDTAAIETLRVDIEVADQVSRELKRRLQKAEIAVAAADRDRRAAARSYLTETAIVPARAKVSAMFAALKSALAGLMAAHHLAEIEFEEPASQKFFYDVVSMYGPAGQFVGELQKLRWTDWPYSVRPDWFGQTAFTPTDFPEVASIKQSLLEDLARKGLS